MAPRELRRGRFFGEIFLPIWSGESGIGSGWRAVRDPLQNRLVPPPRRSIYRHRRRGSVTFVFDDSGIYDAPVELIWKYFSSAVDHRVAHRHRNSRLTELTDTSFIASWEQEYEGRPVTFSMRGTSFYPLGLAYEVLEGPIAGSKFLFYYTPLGQRTRVTLVGEFSSPTIPPGQLPSKVMDFFSTEFEQDAEGIRQMTLHL